MQIANTVLFTARRPLQKKNEPINPLTAAQEIEDGLKGHRLRGLKVDWNPGLGAGWETSDNLRLTAQNPDRLLDAFLTTFKRRLSNFSPARPGGYQAQAEYKGVDVQMFGTKEVPWSKN